MRRPLFALLVLVASVVSVASAQTPERTIDLTSLGWGPLFVPRPIETDGNLATSEWLIQSRQTHMLRVVQERPGGLCVGEWFDPRIAPFEITELIRVGLTHRLLLYNPFNQATMRTVRLDTPSC